MTQIQLVKHTDGTQEGYLDLKENLPVPITFSVAEIRDLQERNGSFSKSIKLPGTKNNNLLLNNYFEVNVVSGEFNLNKLQRCVVIEDGVVIIDNALLQLVSVDKISEGPYKDELVEYTVLVKVTAADFFTIINQRNLKDINLTKYNTYLTAANIQSTFNNTYVDGFKFIMPTAGDTNYDLYEWQPGIYARTYWDKIFEAAGFTYQWDEMTAMKFNNLIIPYAGDKPKGSADTTPELVVIADKSADYIAGSSQVVAGSDGIPYSFVMPPIIIDNEIQDEFGSYNPATSTYTAPSYSSGSGALIFEYEIDYQLIFVNSSGANVILKQASTNQTSGLNFRIRQMMRQVKNGTVLNTHTINIVDKYIPGGTVLAPGNTTIEASTRISSIAFNQVNLNDTFKENMLMFINNDSFMQWKNAANVPKDVGITFKITNIRKTIKPSIQNIGYQSLLLMNNYIPNMKQSDFIKSIIGMYNLYIDVDKNDITKLIIKSRDKYYDDGTVVNWNKKWMKEKPTTLQFLPQLSSKKLVLSYKEDKDEPNVGYKDNVGEIYGQYEYTFENEYVKNVKRQEIQFGPSPLARESFGAYTTILNGAMPKTLPRILYDGGVKTCSTYTITQYPGSVVSLTSYPYTGHYDDPTNPKFDLNYGQCDYYFEYTLGLTENNLTNLYWRRTLGQINNGKMLTGYFNLTPIDIMQLNLNCKVELDNAYWIINKIIDYDANSQNPTKVELMSADEFVKLPKFGRIIRPPKPVPIKPIKPLKGDVINAPIREIKKQIKAQKNIDLSSSNTNIQGEYNYVGEQVKGAIILGDNNAVTDGNKIVLGDNITATKDGIYVGTLLITEDGIGTSEAKIIDGGEDVVLPLDKTNYIDIIDGGFNSVRNFGGDSKERPIIDGNDNIEMIQ